MSLPPHDSKDTPFSFESVKDTWNQYVFNIHDFWYQHYRRQIYFLRSQNTEEKTIQTLEISFWETFRSIHKQKSSLFKESIDVALLFCLIDDGVVNSAVDMIRLMTRNGK